MDHVALEYNMHAYACRHHQKIEPASHGSNDPGNDSNTELSKEGIKGHKEELKNMQVCCTQLCSCVSRTHKPEVTMPSVTMAYMYCRTKLPNMIHLQRGLWTRMARHRV